MKSIIFVTLITLSMGVLADDKTLDSGTFNTSPDFDVPITKTPTKPHQESVSEQDAGMVEKQLRDSAAQTILQPRRLPRARR